MASGAPPVAVSPGDPSGIGLEVVAKAHTALRGEVPFFVIADPRHLPPGTDYTTISAPDDARHPGALPVLPHAFAALATPGIPDPANAIGVVEALDRAIAFALSGAASALCTLPISKKELVDHAAFAHPGHTEYLAAKAEVGRVVMMLAAEELKVVPATIHIALAEVPAALTPEALEETIRITLSALTRDFGIAEPRIAISGLNPHAGEGGLLGREETDWIAPLCATLREEGLRITGPLPADTMFHARAREGYDAAIAMYHDQALIPIKTLAFDRGVNVTLGLPFVRTSPDHGTAFDIAGRGIAEPTSAIEALRLAWRMAQARHGA